jgi:hypothetical protein
MDFTLNNESIKAYFDGNSENAPVSELVYLHLHPLITPNFVTEIETLVNAAEKVIIAKKMTGYPIERLINIAIQMGTNLDDVNHETAKPILSSLRELYKLCNLITGKRVTG